MQFRSLDDEKWRKWYRETTTWLRVWTGGPLMKLSIVLQNAGMVYFIWLLLYATCVQFRVQCILSCAPLCELVFGVYCKVPKDEKYQRQEPEEMKKTVEAI
jgi:hypothetical protein